MSSREDNPFEATNRYRFLLRAIVLGVVICLSPAWISSSYAQQAATATLSGRIVDPNQAVVTGAQVTATQTATAIGRSTTTNAEGMFVVTNLPTGEYEVKIQAAGFASRTVTLTLQVGQNETLNTTLSVESVSADDPTNAGFLRSSSFGQPVTTAGGVFGSGGPRAFQFAARVTF